ncbi:ABC-2 transporter permease (plasmid) [Aneurinibacillus sp. Ricciae_BoGa-3]|uniref:ABC-2 transporter permease n=1 Tax=Aneurinibacillus sp. Ricciae_BoGa-3 TaxID=3022697 RepID=UPI0023423CFB|nr:ABC-2 transporter permease [Aneurinibacillus sp. Ricciae_BoGa-3]WCK57031.1 ABC-2 transporter permease [Aneurinibacillus sp. Ricciae_BoGa-3]
MKKHLKLFKKDFLLQRKTLPLTVILILGLFFINKTPEIKGLLINFSFISCVFIISNMIVTTSMVHDDKNNAMMMLSGLPFSRKRLVFNRYFFSNVVTILCSVVVAFVFLAIHFILPQTKFDSVVYVSDVFFSLALVNFYFVTVFPLFFKFGYAKTQMFNMMVLMVVMGATAVLMYTLPATPAGVKSTSKVVISGMIPGVIGLVLSYLVSFFSYKLSVFLFKSREF